MHMNCTKDNQFHVYNKAEKRMFFIELNLPFLTPYLQSSVIHFSNFRVKFLDHGEHWKQNWWGFSVNNKIFQSYENILLSQMLT